MTKKYIKNCTGDQCEKDLSKSNIVSVVIFYVLLACFAGVSVFVLFFSDNLKVTSIDVDGTAELSDQDIQRNIENSLQGKYLGVIPKNNFLFISQKKMENLLMNDFKKIRSVTVVKKFPDTFSVSIDERRALLVWCGGEKCYLLDEKGVAYGDADFSSEQFQQNHLLQINDTSAREIKIGEKIIEPSYEQYALNIKDELAAIGFNVTGQYYTPSRMAEEINVKTDQESTIYFSTQFELSSALRTLTAILKKEIPEEKRSDISYIDLRNENKAFYKFKNIEPIVMENTETVSTEKVEEKK